MILPLEESEVPPPSRAAEYAAPATPALETVFESPGYTVPEEFVVEATEGSTSTAMCQGAQDIGPDLTREGPFDACEANPKRGSHRWF